jgi:hypothetical protein
VRLVYRAKVGVKRVEGLQRSEEVSFNKIPVVLVKSRTKAIRPGTGVVIHGEESTSNFL